MEENSSQEQDSKPAEIIECSEIVANADQPEETDLRSGDISSLTEEEKIDISSQVFKRIGDKIKNSETTISALFGAHFIEVGDEKHEAIKDV